MKNTGKKIVIVTGASKGIGRAIAIRLIEANYNVHGVHSNSLADADQLTAEYGIIFHQADLSHREQTLKLAKELSILKPHALINNAGIWEMDEMDGNDFSTWDKTLEVNLTAPFILSRLLSKSMDSGSSIINIASTDGLTGAYNGISYSASKAALINVTKASAILLVPKIYVSMLLHLDG